MSVITGLFPYHVRQRDDGYWSFSPFDQTQWRGPYSSIEELVQEALAPLLVRSLEEQFAPKPTQQ